MLTSVITWILSHCCLLNINKTKVVNVEQPNVLIKLCRDTKFLDQTYIKFVDQVNYVVIPISSQLDDNPIYIQEVLNTYLEYDIESQAWYLKYNVYEHYSQRSINTKYKSPVEFKDELEYVSFTYHSRSHSYKPNSYRRFK